MVFQMIQLILIFHFFFHQANLGSHTVDMRCNNLNESEDYFYD